MAHQIRNNDHLVLAGKSAWHGLGTVTEGAPNPFAALRLARLEWDVLPSASISGIFNPGETDEFRVSTDTAQVLVRSDDKSVLGVVGPDYTPVQNSQLAELAYALRDAGSDRGVEIESAGSLYGGRRVWFLIRAASIEMGGKGDATVPYFMLTNAHDGTASLQGLGTGTRVVCANTMRIALGEAKDRIAFRHTSGIGTRVEEMAGIIKQWFANMEKGQAVASRLAAKPMNRAAIQALWVEVVQRLDGEIPNNPTNGWEETRREKAVVGLAHMAQVFDRESQQYGANLWVAANAATNWVQHVRSQYAIRKGDSTARAYAQWNGSTADDSAEVWKVATAAV
jgi:phage/plasmid-like protein (TIGR03299 family)